MTKRLIIGALATLGLVAVPTFTQARETGHDNHADHAAHVAPDRGGRVEHADRPVIRDVHRDVHVDEHVVVDHDRHWDRGHIDIVPAPVVVAPAPVVVAPYTDTPVAINQVPPAVLNAAAARTGSAPIVGVDFVQNAGGTFYDVHVTGPYNSIQTLRFGINGGFYGNV